MQIQDMRRGRGFTNHPAIVLQPYVDGLYQAYVEPAGITHPFGSDFVPFQVSVGFRGRLDGSVVRNSHCSRTVIPKKTYPTIHHLYGHVVPRIVPNIPWLTAWQVDQETVAILNVRDGVHQADGSAHARGQIYSIAAGTAPLTGLWMTGSLVSYRYLNTFGGMARHGDFALQILYLTT
jgi:hypothetical protein